MISMSQVKIHFSIACSQTDKELLSKKILDTLDIFWRRRFESDYRSVIEDMCIEVRSDNDS